AVRPTSPRPGCALGPAEHVRASLLAPQATAHLIGCSGTWSRPRGAENGDHGPVPELPEVEALAAFLRENAVGQVVTRVDLAAVQAIKTFDPPLSALAGLEVTGATRHGKFLDLDVSGLHLVVHLARAGWLHWRSGLPALPPKPGKGPLALRVHLGDGEGFDLTEQGTR